MKKLLSIFLTILCTINLNAQVWDVLEEWPDEILRNVKLASTNSSASPTGNRILFLLNLARTDGSLFKSTVLQRFIDSTSYDSNRDLISLMADLEKVKNLPLLKYDSVLESVAQKHAVSMGKKGKTGHDGFTDRYKVAMQTSTMVAENCFYGPEEPLIIVTELLIDAGVPTLGHRKNILERAFSRIGIWVAPHKEYVNNCVMSFGN
ncbi:MAG: hypothetical protein CVU06_11630 [Bacteroidetes bacterium HGW-Bacteroidetes-22]|nr:MAG: hypothetical protein CVU06_11630 [Bacteroidetes bacterium HGW-Bacteroidetes-22]